MLNCKCLGNRDWQKYGQFVFSQHAPGRGSCTAILPREQTASGVELPLQIQAPVITPANTASLVGAKGRISERLAEWHRQSSVIHSSKSCSGLRVSFPRQRAVSRYRKRAYVLVLFGNGKNGQYGEPIRCREQQRSPFSKGNARDVS